MGSSFVIDQHSLNDQSLIFLIYFFLSFFLQLLFAVLGVIGILLKTNKSFIETILKGLFDGADKGSTKEQIQQITNFVLDNSSEPNWLFLHYFSSSGIRRQ